MNLFNWIGFGDLEDLVVNASLVAIAALTGALLWGMGVDRMRRRKAKRDNDLDRFQDQ